MMRYMKDFSNRTCYLSFNLFLPLSLRSPPLLLIAVAPQFVEAMLSVPLIQSSYMGNSINLDEAYDPSNRTQASINSAIILIDRFRADRAFFLICLFTWFINIFFSTAFFSAIQSSQQLLDQLFYIYFFHNTFSGPPSCFQIIPVIVHMLRALHG